MRRVVKSFIIKLVPGVFHLTESIHRGILFYARVMFLKVVTQFEHRIPVYNIVFLGGLDLILYSA